MKENSGPPLINSNTGMKNQNIWKTEKVGVPGHNEYMGVDKIKYRYFTPILTSILTSKVSTSKCDFIL